PRTSLGAPLEPGQEPLRRRPLQALAVLSPGEQEQVARRHRRVPRAKQQNGYARRPLSCRPTRQLRQLPSLRPVQVLRDTMKLRRPLLQTERFALKTSATSREVAR